MTIKELKSGDFFTFEPVKAEAKESQVWIRRDYDRAEKKYWCEKFSDMNCGKYVRGDREINTEFIF